MEKFLENYYIDKYIILHFYSEWVVCKIIKYLCQDKEWQRGRYKIEICTGKNKGVMEEYMPMKFGTYYDDLTVAVTQL